MDDKIKTYFPNIVGQDNVKRSLAFYIDGHEANSIVPHLMFTAPRGCGKTTIAEAFARNLKHEGAPKRLVTLNCAGLKNLNQFFNLFVIPYISDKDCTVLFDEASEIPRDVGMALLTILNPNPRNRNEFSYEDYNFEFDFSRQSFMFATTEGQSIFHALMDRMERIDLEEYEINHLGEILMLGLDGYEVDDVALYEMSKTLRGNARAAQKMSVKVKQYLDQKDKKKFNMDDWNGLRKALSIIPMGLTNGEVNLLRVLKRKKSTRLTELVAITGNSRRSIQADYEMFPTKLGLIEIRPEGRCLTGKGQDYLKKLDTD
jgi:Holliday junction resolvasome RuvABC ATP-dependent DNA helicase subunit